MPVVVSRGRLHHCQTGLVSVRSLACVTVGMFVPVRAWVLASERACVRALVHEHVGACFGPHASCVHVHVHTFLVCPRVAA